MNKIEIAIYGFALGFLANSITMRLIGVIDDQSIMYPITIFAMMGLLAIAKLNRD